MTGGKPVDGTELYTELEYDDVLPSIAVALAEDVELALPSPTKKLLLGDVD